MSIYGIIPVPQNNKAAGCWSNRTASNQSERTGFRMTSPILPQFKICTKCGDKQLASEFIKDASKKDGLRPICKTCDRAARKIHTVKIPPKHKACTKCNTLKPFSDFHADGNKRDGCYPVCKECRNHPPEAIPEAKKPGHKVCAKCRIEKPESEFYKSSNTQDGLRSGCKHCFNKQSIKWGKNNKDRVRFLQKRLRKSNPYRAKIKASTSTANRQAKKYGIGEKVTSADVRKIFDRDKACLRCGTKNNLSIDHIVPLSKGGNNLPGNLQTLCRYCNSKKYNKIIDYRVER